MWWIRARLEGLLDYKAEVVVKLLTCHKSTRAEHLPWLLVVSCAKVDGLFFAADALCLVRKLDGLFFAADVTPRNPRNAPRCKP